MSRVDAARFGAMKGVLPLKGCVAASDAFFSPSPTALKPWRQQARPPLSSPAAPSRDQDVIDAADRLGAQNHLRSCVHAPCGATHYSNDDN